MSDLDRSNHVFVIAEAGVNHNGSAELAHQLIDIAADAGANAVKFQTFNAESLVTRTLEKASYQRNITDPDETQFGMLKRLELPRPVYKSLADHAFQRDIEFLSTPFDLQSLDFLVNEVGVKKLKVPSGDITNGPLLLAEAKTCLPLLISTGMATIHEVERALGVIAYGLTCRGEIPKEFRFEDAVQSVECSALQKQVTLLHCTSEYPAPDDEMNLHAIRTLADYFQLPVGLSDHSRGTVLSISAVALGARVIEKHFTLNRQLPGPDHSASLEPGELKEMIVGIRRVERALGDGVKRPATSELKNQVQVRKSLVASRPIKKGELFSEENMAAKRPGNGLSPMRFWELLGTLAGRDYQMDEPIEER